MIDYQISFQFIILKQSIRYVYYELHFNSAHRGTFDCLNFNEDIILCFNY